MGRRPPGVAPFPIEGADVLRTRATVFSATRRDVCREGLAQGDATLTFVQALKTGSLLVSRP